MSTTTMSAAIRSAGARLTSTGTTSHLPLRTVVARRSMHQEGRHESTPSTTTSPHVPPSAGASSSTSTSGLPPVESADPLPYVSVSKRGQDPTRRSAGPSSQAHTKTSALSGRPLIVKEFTAKGKPLYARPPVPLSVRQRMQELSPPENGSPYVEDESRSVHPLWKFFHVPHGAKRLGLDLGEGNGEVGNGAGMGSLETLETNDVSEIMTSGRSWSAQELRTKSFEDLHTLWYLLLRERNVLATQREERRRVGVSTESELITKRAYRCRKSMARIKYVLNERRLALIAAAESSRPSNERSKIMGRSPLGRVDPLAVNGWEDGIADRLAAPLPASLDDVAVVNTVDASELESPLGDGERQKRDVVTEVDEGSATVEDAEVAKQEVEGRDEGFGGGQEAKEFVKDMERKGL